MKTEITKLDIENEMDIVLAHRRAMQVSKFAGSNISEQTRFATAVSEICRNALEFCKGGKIIYSIVPVRESFYDLEAIVSDCGPGIRDLEQILSRNLMQHTGKGRGIVFSKKLVDSFKIVSNAKGTHVTLGMHVPANGQPINKLIIQGWIKYMKSEPPLTAYEDLKIRNAGLLQLTDELREEKLKTEKQFKQINELNEKLQKTNSYLEEFTYTVSHDLKTPLTTLNLSLRFLEEADDQESKMSFIEIIGRAAKRLERTVQGLVEILDVQTKTENLAKKIKLEAFFEDIAEEFSPAIVGKGINFTHDFMVSEIYYLPVYLNSIFTNFISNAIKYRVSNRPLNLLVTTRRRGGMIILTFKDNGEGIDLEKFGSRLFTPFTRFNTEQEGKGIGLYIVKKMIEKNGGKIEVESEIGKGTTFIIYLREYT